MNTHPNTPITDARGIVLLDEGDPRATTCLTCSKSWDDSVATGWTPAPAGRCPWESEHPADDAPACAWCGREAAFRNDRTDAHYCHTCWQVEGHRL